MAVAPLLSKVRHQEPKDASRSDEIRHLAPRIALAVVGSLAFVLVSITGLPAKDVEHQGQNLNPMIFAQQQPRPPARPPAAPAQPAAQAPATPQPQRTERVTYDAWTLTCTQTGNDPKKICSAILQVAEQQNQRVVFAWLIGRTPEGALTTVFRTPTGVQIQKGVELKLGTASSRRANFVICNQQSCEASLTMDDGVVREAVSSVGANGVATLTIADGRQINFTMPLKGIDKVIAAMGR